MSKRRSPRSFGPQTRAYYEALGYMVGRCDCTGSRRRPSHDLFGFADYIGFDWDLIPGLEDQPGSPRHELHCVLIQVTDSTSHAKHRKKILASGKARRIERLFPDSLRIELISWRRGSNTPRVESMRPLLREVAWDDEEE